MRIHPVERKAFLDVEFVIRVGVENELRQQRIDGHHRHLAADLEAIVDDADIFAGLELARFVGKTAVVLKAFLRVDQVFLKGVLGVVRGRRTDFVAIN